MPARSRAPIDALVLKHRDLPRRVARAWFAMTACEADREDLVGAARVGLIEAARRFRSRKGAFEPYARSRMRGAIRDHLRAQDHLSRDMRRYRAMIAQAHDELQAAAAAPPDSSAVAARLGVTEARLAKLVAKATPPKFSDLDGHSTGHLSLCEVVPSPSAPIDSTVGARLDVREALHLLDKRRRHAIVEHFLRDRALREIGQDFYPEVSEARVCQMVKEGLRVMREGLDLD